MAGGGAWWRRVSARSRTLRALVRDTQRALRDAGDVMQFEPDISTSVHDIGALVGRATAIVVLGGGAARARLLHCLLGRRLLPDDAPRGGRWLRIQFGTTTQVHLTLGNSEFELVEDLQCNQAPWEVLPVEDLLRQDQTDLTTVLEVELNNSILKDGLKIILPPDIGDDPTPSATETLKQQYSDLYKKRELILKNFNLVYLFAIDRIGKCVFSDSFYVDSKMATSRSEEDFWLNFSLYYTKESGGGSDGDAGGERSAPERSSVGYGGDAVLTPENCLDLQQIKEMDPNAQVLFVLFSDSVDAERRMGPSDATESTEETVFRTEELPESDQELVMDGVIRHTPESPERGFDNRRLYEEQISFMNELLDQWELSTSPPSKHHVKSQYLIIDELSIMASVEKNKLASDFYMNESLNNKRDEDDKTVRNRLSLSNSVGKFATESVQSYLLEFSQKLSEVHIKLVQQLVLSSLDLARELQVVPRRVLYVANSEQQLYETINEKFSEGDKKQELVKLMQEALDEIRAEIHAMDWSVDDLPCHQDDRFVVSNSVFYSSISPEDISLRTDSTNIGPVGPTVASVGQDQPSDGEEAVSYDSYNFDDFDIIDSNDESLYMSGFRRYRPKPETDTSSLTSQIGAIKVENESEMFSLSSSAVRTAWGADTSRGGLSTGTCDTGNVSLKQASMDVQQTVLSKLSRKISKKLVEFVNCLNESYFGTLQRCLDSLESSCRLELGGRPASEAMRQLASVARQVDLRPAATFSLLRSLAESVRRLLNRLGLPPRAPAACCPLSARWRRRAAAGLAAELSAARIARLISTQILSRLSVAHSRYQAALASLQAALAARLHHTEDTKLAIRKRYAPAFARLCLESTSMCDLLMYGVPELGREIGRGQYGVVYACAGWAGATAAVKSVMPADERHYHELAMEFFYTRSIPPHPRIVRLLGSVVQRRGAGPAVLLASERRVRDLHAAVRAGLSFAKRLRISCDIVEGIRYLHSLGLVHRDIKMKNVLLDSEDRASLSDLGFCALEALMSGSVVGTPVHMAPELLNGAYDSSVDVYAFGILFWYVCAGNTRLPTAFEVFQNKEQLWSKVKRGLRPERLPHFTDECWDIMESCWASEPSERALLGHIEPRLHAILEQAIQDDNDDGKDNTRNSDYYVSDDESLDMTGVGGLDRFEC